MSLFTGAHTHIVYSPPPAPTDEEMQDDKDEFGRTKADQKAPRSEGRTARRAARAGRRRSTVSSEDHGAATDDELDLSTAADLSSALAELRQSLAELFSDVKAANFRDPNLGIRKRFEEWREKHGEEYQNAFGGLALVAVWEFWGRVEGVGAEVSAEFLALVRQNADDGSPCRSITKRDRIDRRKASRPTTGINLSPLTVTPHLDRPALLRPRP